MCHILKEHILIVAWKKNPGGKVEESNRYVYNESSQLTEAVLYNGTGIQLKVSGETSPTEEELIKLIAPSCAALTSKYELIEYINDVNREYAEVLVELNLNGRTDTTYTYGVDRISKELFNQTCRTSYYLYDPRGSETIQQR